MGLRGRMRALNAKLLQIRFGPGAAILPKEVKRIHLDFAYSWHNGHLGPRKFWRECLPRLKYHNPMVGMTVQRTRDHTTKPTMTVYFEDSTTKAIDMHMKMPADILQDFLKTTNATPVEPTREEEEELKTMEQQQIDSAADRTRSAQDVARKKEDQRLLDRAKQGVS